MKRRWWATKRSRAQMAEVDGLVSERVRQEIEAVTAPESVDFLRSLRAGTSSENLRCICDELLATMPDPVDVPWGRTDE